MLEEELFEIVYKLKCKGCPYERNCHETCTTCEEFEEELERLKENE